MPVSATVAAGQLATAAQMNALRTDVLDLSTATGHDHSGGSAGKVLPNPVDEYLATIYFDEEDVA